MSDVISTARQASDHPALETAARVGYAVSGLLHLLIGWIALQVAWGLGGGGSGQNADQTGALQSLAGNGLGMAVLWIGVLGFLGLGAQPPSSEWGVMISDGQNYLLTAWWLSTFPGIAIILVGVGFSLIGDGLADILRPGD